jgi:TRAP-type C4-dicarboxylate transport system substrate-binding protein
MQNEEALEWAVNEQRMEVIELTQEETDKWIKAVEPMIDKYVDQTGETGQRAIDTAKRLADKYNNVY